MIETPVDWPGYPGADLRAYAAEIGGVPEPIPRDKPCPILFRDVGPDGLAEFLAGHLRDLAGNEAPVVWLRTAEAPLPTRAAREFGEIILLRPMSLLPWRTCERGVYVASRAHVAAPGSLGFVPPGSDRLDLAKRARRLSTEEEWRDRLSPRVYDTARGSAKKRVESYRRERDLVDAAAAPLRRALRDDPAAARREMERLGLREEDLCGPWFGLTPARRREVRRILGARVVRGRAD